jgi:hypothetical protein
MSLLACYHVVDGMVGQSSEFHSHLKIDSRVVQKPEKLDLDSARRSGSVRGRIQPSRTVRMIVFSADCKLQ